MRLRSPGGGQCRGLQRASCPADFLMKPTHSRRPSAHAPGSRHNVGDLLSSARSLARSLSLSTFSKARADRGRRLHEIPAPEEAARQCPAPPASSAASLGYGYPFGGSYYGCRLSHSHNVNLQQKPCAYHPAEKIPEPSGSLPSEELSSRAKEFAFYPSFARISGHPEPRHDALLPMEGYQHWALFQPGTGRFTARRSNRSPPPWKSPFPDVVPLQPEVNSYRRGRKKRVPYTKIQLKELEKEYSASKFITKEKRRRISATTNLSERQVTIWFQNRRVKEKKVISKSKTSHLHAT
uniref:Homeobox C13 n=1 Tax=Laticauda laticaudata TaxID=8630 RepID=A0A8C5RQR9_LATLA